MILFKAQVWSTAVLALVLAVEGSVMAEEIRPFDVGSRSQVFIDRALVGSAEGVTFTLHPARKHPMGLWLQRQREKRGPAGPMVLYDAEEKVFKGWATNAYNTSKDGLTWGETEPADDTWRYIVRVSVIKDLKDPAPSRRYKLLTFGPSRDFPPGLQDADKVKNPDGTETLFWYCKGYNTYISPDGRALTHLSPKPILLNAEGKSPGDMLNAYYDERLGLFVAFLKMTSRETKFTRRRCFGMMTSKDFETWSEAKLIFVPDQLDDDGAMERIEAVRPLLLLPTDRTQVNAQMYGVGGPIQLESGVIVLLRVFITHNKGDALSEIQMAFSRDLARWERPFRQAFIPRGKVGSSPETSEWDTCWFNNEGPAVIMGDEVWVYYTARNTPHDHPVGFARGQYSAEVTKEAQKHVGTKYVNGTGIAVWKRDRFVSVDAPAAGGTLTTVPLVFTGSRLELNAATQPDGEIAVELMDKGGKALARSKPFSGDDLRHRVAWDGPVNLAELAGKPVSLRFRMKNAALYAFAFRS